MFVFPIEMFVIFFFIDNVTEMILNYSVARQPVGILANCGQLTSEAALKVTKSSSL
mgnify:CR=1 FL=1